MSPPLDKYLTDVAVYSDRGVWEESVIAAEKMFRWMNYTSEIIDARHINDDGLANFTILCIPGGDMYQYSQDISAMGKENIKRFIQEGGGYIGICGGAYFAGEKVVWQGDQLPMTSLGLFKGTAYGPSDEIIPYPNFTMCRVDIVNSNHPTTKSEPDSLWMLYYGGPTLMPAKEANVTILGRYSIVNQPSILAFDYGLGRVFLIGAHPEIEEDSDRDGVSFGNECDDQGSDWVLMERAVLWLLRRIN